MGLSLLTLLIALPLIGAALILLVVRHEDDFGRQEARVIALATSAVTFVVSLFLWFGFDSASSDYQFVEKVVWFENYNISYHLGIDGISLFMVLLTTFLTPICILCSWESVQKRVRAYMVSFLLLEALVIGAFCALDLLLFYVFFEFMLIPMYLIIGIWGGQNRIYAAYKFFLYTLAGSILFLAALMYLYTVFGTTDIPDLAARAPGLPMNVQIWLWLAMFTTFAVKVPMWPVHTWLPDAHVQAPTAGSVILAGILLKMGAYGYLRLSLPLLPAASSYFTPLIYGLSIVAIIYTSLVALRQEDMKKLIAYSSVAHMGFVTIGIFSFNAQGLEGALIQMISHGLVSGALFLCVGVVYDRLHTREIAAYGGVATIMPRFALVFMLFTMGAVGLPGTSGFVGEFLILMGAFRADTRVAFFATTGIILGAAYMLYLYRRVMYGEITNPEVKTMPELRVRELICFLPIMAVVLWMGLYPTPFLKPMHASVSQLLTSIGASESATREKE